MDFSFIISAFITIIFFLILGLASILYEKYINLHNLKKIRKNNNKQDYIDFSVILISKDQNRVDRLKNSVLFFDKYIKDDLLKFSTDEDLKTKIINAVSEINNYSVINPSDGWNSIVIQDLANKLILELKKL